MALYYNPFDFLTETYTYPHARTLRTSYFQKLRDASRIFAGRYWDSADCTSHYTLGIIDYLTLGLFVLPVKWADWCERNYTDSLVAKLLYLPVNFLELLVKIARWVLAITFVLVASLFIAVIHGVSRLFRGNPLKILDIQGQEKTTEIYAAEGVTKSLRDVLKEFLKKRLGLPDASAISDQACLTVSLETRCVQNSLYLCDPTANNRPIFVFPSEIKTNVDAAQKQGALYYLNFFHVTEEMEKQGLHGSDAQDYQCRREDRGLR